MSRFAILKPQLTWETVLSRRGMAGAAALAAMLALGFTWGSWSRVCAAERCPSIARLMGSNSIPQQTSKIYAADGRLITELGLERRTVLPLREIPPWVRAAFLATEDKRFYQHHGIDYWRILGSLKANLTSLSYAQGFSTITMQLARNIFPDQIKREKSLPRKLKEARVALEIEHNFPKDTILHIVTHDSTMIRNTLAMAETFARIGYPPAKLRYLVNRADAASGIDPGELAAKLGREPEYRVRSDGAVVVPAGNRGQAFVVSDPDALVSRDVIDIARRIAPVRRETERLATAAAN